MQGRAGKPGPMGPSGQKVGWYIILPQYPTVCIRVRMVLQEKWVLQEPQANQDQWCIVLLSPIMYDYHVTNCRACKVILVSLEETVHQVKWDRLERW